MNTANGENRGYFKIKGAASAFDFDFRRKTVLDIGSSTGGFTKYALDRGAKKVIAVEKGTNQMRAPLRYNPRIELHEKTDIFEVASRHVLGEVAPNSISKEAVLSGVPRETSPKSVWRGASLNFVSEGTMPKRISSTSQTKTIDTPDVIIADVSFLSLTKILKYAKLNLARSDTDYLVMLKPQFEARADQLRNGIIKNHQIRRDIIKNFEGWLKRNGFIIIKKRDSEMKGRNGNEERFYWLRQVKT